MKIGLIGAGRIGTFHAEALAGSPEVDSLCIADVDVARARSLLSRLLEGSISHLPFHLESRSSELKTGSIA